MPQFRVQRSNTHFFFKISATFFLTQCERHKKQEQERDKNKNKNKNANNRTQDANKNETRCKQEKQITEQGQNTNQEKLQRKIIG